MPEVVSAIERLQHGMPAFAIVNEGNPIEWAMESSGRLSVPIVESKVKLGQACVSCNNSTCCTSCEFLTSIPKLKVKVMEPYRVARGVTKI